MWVDKKTHWAWVGKQPFPCPPPPSKKMVEYMKLKKEFLATTVYDDGVPTKINQDELAWYMRFE